MPVIDPVGEVDERFSGPGATVRPWPEVAGMLDQAVMFWLSTVRRDGRPHVTPLPAMWLDGALHFCTGPEEQKARNLQRDPACVLTTGSGTFGSGWDVIVEGRAARVTDRPLLQRLAQMWQDRLDWPFEPTEEGFRERSTQLAGEDFDARGSAHVYAVAPDKVLLFGKGKPFSQVRYRFG